MNLFFFQSQELFPLGYILKTSQKFYIYLIMRVRTVSPKLPHCIISKSLFIDQTLN